MSTEFEEMLDTLYRELADSPVLDAYMQRHGIDAAGFLTVTSDEHAGLIAERLAPPL